MNAFLNAFLDLFKTWDRGELPNYPDPSPPGDLGTALTQPEIDWVKSLKKEMTQRFDTNVCSDEKTGVGIPVTTASSFTISWSNPVGYIGTQILYRVSGSPTWLTPNAIGNATGTFVDTENFHFTAGFTAGTVYEVLVKNSCASGYLSDGVMVSDTAT